MNIKKLTTLSIACSCLIATTLGVILIKDNKEEINRTTADANVVHTLTIDRFVQIGVYSKDGYYIEDGVGVAQLKYPGSYCLFYEWFYSGGKAYNDGTKIYENTYLYESGHSYANSVRLYLYQLNNYYFTRDDYENSRPINMPGFSDLRSIKMFMGEGNELKLNTSSFSSTVNYNDETKSYTFTGDISSPFSFGNENYIGTGEENNGKKLVIKSFEITYGCSR